MFRLLENKGFLLLFGINIVLFFLDLWTTLWNAHLLPILEINPLYRATGTLFLPILLNVVMFIIYWFMYKHSKPDLRYLLIVAFVVLALFRLVAIGNAVEWSQTDITIEEIKEVYTEEVILEAQKEYQYNMFFLGIMSILPFCIWRLDHVIKKRKRIQNH